MYHVEFWSRNHEKTGNKDFPETADARTVYQEFLREVQKAEYAATLRVHAGWYDGLIADADDGKIFWYWNYPEYKKFADALGFEPAAEQRVKEFREWDKRFSA